MVTNFKEFVLPILVYLMVMLACIWGLRGKGDTPVFLYLVLLAFPQIAQAANSLPLGSRSLTLLILSGLFAAVVRGQRAPSDGATRNLVFAYLLYLTFSLLVLAWRYGFYDIFETQEWVFESWRNWILTVLLYVLGYRLLRTDRQIVTLAVLLAVALLLLSFREFRNFYGGSTFSYLKRAGETFGLRGLNSNHFAAFVAYLAAFVLGMFAEDKRKWRRLLYLAAICAGIYPLFFSYSRGAYAAFALALLAVGATRYRPLLLLGLFVAVFWQTIIPDSVVDRVTMTETPDGELEESAALRLVVWNLAEDLFKNNPIFGIGFQGFYFASADLPLHNAHNYFLQTAAEQGLVGLALLVVILLRAIYVGWIVARNAETAIRRGLGLGLFALTLSLVVANIFGDRFSLMELGSYFWFFFGAAQRILNEQRDLAVLGDALPVSPAPLQNLPTPSGAVRGQEAIR